MSYSSSLTFDPSDKGRYACACVISFALSLISTSMFSKYFKIFVNENNIADPLYQKFRNDFLILWLLFLGKYLFLSFVLLPRKNFKDLISEATFNKPLKLPSKVNVSLIF